MKVLTSNKWIMVGYHEPSELYVFANKNAFAKYNEVELECLPCVKYVNTVLNRVSFYGPSEKRPDNVSACNFDISRIGEVLKANI